MTKIHIFSGFYEVLVEVGLALIPLAAIFWVLQTWSLKLSKKRVVNISKGLILTFFGLALFLQGVYIGFLPVGQVMGAALGNLNYKWLLIPIGFILGFAATFAEPAVRVFNYEVEKASGGYIPQVILLYTLSFGVGISMALSMGRIIFGLPLWYFIIPGYLICFILMYYSDPSFVSIAFDSGGVATGPMTVTFLLAMTLGVASAMEGRDPLTEGFGMVALVALSLVLSVLILGFLYGRKEKQNVRELSDE